MKNEIKCLNPDCDYMFKISKKIKTLQKTEICPKCGTKNLLQDLADKLLIDVLKANKEERCS